MTNPAFESRLDANPADWTTRLVYADWLEEQGCDEEAAFQRWSAKWRGYWEVVASFDDDGTPIGFRVRWSSPDQSGRYWWNGHYLTDGVAPSLGWCEVAAEGTAKRWNLDRKLPGSSEVLHAAK